MRFKELRTNESYDTFLKGLLGTPASLASFGQMLPDEPTDGSSSTDGSTTTADVPSGLPVNGPITSKYGQRSDGMHYGVDFGVPVGTPIVAPDDGVILSAGPAADAGIMVAINSNGVQHKLMHLSQIKVKAGDSVKRGQVVGLSGNTGNSRGPHLHWSKYVGGRPVDPMSNIG